MLFFFVIFYNIFFIIYNVVILAWPLGPAHTDLARSHAEPLTRNAKFNNRKKWYITLRHWIKLRPHTDQPRIHIFTFLIESQENWFSKPSAICTVFAKRNNTALSACDFRLPIEKIMQENRNRASSCVNGTNEMLTEKEKKKHIFRIIIRQSAKWKCRPNVTWILLNTWLSHRPAALIDSLFMRSPMKKIKWKQFDTEPYNTKFKYIYIYMNMSECEAHRSNLHAVQQWVLLNLCIVSLVCGAVEMRARFTICHNRGSLMVLQWKFEMKEVIERLGRPSPTVIQNTLITCFGSCRIFSSHFNFNDCAIKNNSRQIKREREKNKSRVRAQNV